MFVAVYVSYETTLGGFEGVFVAVVLFFFGGEGAVGLEFVVEGVEGVFYGTYKLRFLLIHK